MTDPRTLSLASAVARYHAGCLRVIGAQNVAQTDVRTARKAAYPCDLGQLIDREELLRHGHTTIHTPAPPATGQPMAGEEYQQRLAVWERLRELALKAAVEGHQKEVIYAGPLLSGALWKKNLSTCEPVLAPVFLQTVSVAVQDDGTVLIRATDEPPRFNTSVWANAVHKTQADQMVTLGINAQADLSEGWDDDRVEELLAGLHSVFPGLSVSEVDDRLTPWPERSTPAQASKLQPHLRVHPGAALYLANKSSPFLLADLDRIADQPGTFVRQDRPLSVLLSPPAEEILPELEHLDIHEVVFPFPSNGPQRRVAEAVDKNRIVVVQGPPGNGKSLTIANLVSHLVAEGKSVLLCSHKEQALTVVRDKLDEMGLRFLYASMVGTSANTKRELQGQIKDVSAFFAKVNQHTLRRQLREVEDRRRRNGEEYQLLRDDFNDRAEAEQAEAERLALSIEGVALLPADDAVVEEGLRPRVASDLRRLDALARGHDALLWAGLRTLAIANEIATDGRQAALTRFLELQAARLDAATDAEVQDLVRQWQPIADRNPDQVDVARDAVRAIAETLRGPLAAIEDDSDPERVRQFAKAMAANRDLLTDTRRAIEKVSAAFAQARELEDARTAVGADTVRRHEVLMQHGLLGRFMKGGKARKWLDGYAPGAAGLTHEEVGAWVRFWDAWQQVRNDCDALGGELRLEVPASYDRAVITTYLSRLRRALAVAEAIEAARGIARDRVRLRLPLEPLVGALDEADMERHADRWEHALVALGADRSGNQQLHEDLALDWLAQPLRELDAAVDGERHEDARRLIADLQARLAALPDLAERAKILEGPTAGLAATVEAIETAAAAGEPAPDFLGDIDAAFAAQPVVHRLRAIRGGETTRDLAERLKELRETTLADAKQLLSLRIQQRIYEGFRSPKFIASLERFRKAISTSAKRFDRLEELKNSPDFDVDVLTEVFPCWIMRPEDACRMFPLRHDIFDVVVFDEASQCNPDQTLPIFARSEVSVVFGDDNQLSNEDLKRSLAGDANRALLTQSKLIELDPEGLFDQTENSLLGLVSTRDQAPIVLNEHFRCRPELVAFSNTRFYADGLRVMRDAEDDRGLGPAILIHELENVPPLGKSKVNHYEGKLLVEELERLLADERYRGLSIGCLSLFREQIEYIESLVEARVPKSVRDARRLICSTVDGFQGDERDVILYSWRYSPTQSPSIMTFTNGMTGDQRVNVALTRARHQAIHFISTPVERFPATGNVGQFMRHAHEPERLVRVIESLAHKEPITEARRRSARALNEAGLRCLEQFVACGVGVDLVVHDPEDWARVAVFIDGELHPAPPPTADRRVDAQGLLERAGWTVERILAEEAVGQPQLLLERVRAALARCGPRERPEVDAERHFAWDVTPEPEDVAVSAEAPGTGSVSIASEDYADYHWPAPGVEARLAAGEDVFQSDFERELYDRLAQDEDLQVVPQWRSRGKFIDLVLTDRAGRRLAVEADGEQHHETIAGELIPEDVYRERLLEEVGWVFHRVRFTEFIRDPERHIDEIRRHLAARPGNAALAEQVWGDDAVSLDELEQLVEPVEAKLDGDGDGADLERGGGAATRVLEMPAATAEETTVADDDEAREDATEHADDDVRVEPFGAEADVLDEEREDQESDIRSEPIGQPSADQLQMADVQPEGTLHAASASSADVPISTCPSAKPLDPERYEGSQFDHVPLTLLPQQIAIVVNERGTLPDDEIVEAYADRFSVAVPRKRQRLLTSFAWSASGRRFIQKDGDDWLPGDVDPHPIDHLDSWTMAELERLVRELHDQGVVGDALFDHALEHVWDSQQRVPRPVTKAVGSAVYAVVGKRV